MSLKRVAGTMLSIAQTRLELLAYKLEEERLRFEQTLRYRGIALLFGLSIMLLNVFVVVVFWDSQRLPVMGSLAALFFIAGLQVWNASRNPIWNNFGLFPVSLTELSSDRDQLAP